MQSGFGDDSSQNGHCNHIDNENPRLEGFNVSVPLRSESGDLYSFVLDLSADRYGAKELAMNAVTNAQVWHRRLGYLHAQSLRILRKRDWYHIEGVFSDCDVSAKGKAQQLAHSKIVNHNVAGTFNMPTPYQEWVWEREVHIYWSMVTCQGSTRSKLP